MTPPPGRLDLTFNFAANGTGKKQQPTAGVGHVVFIAPYSGAAKPLGASSDFVARPLEVGEAFRIVPSAIQLEPLRAGSEPFLLPFSDTDSLHPDALLETVPGLSELWELLPDLERDSRAAERLAMMVARSATAAWRANSAPESGAHQEQASGNDAVASASTEAAGDLLERLLGRQPEHARGADAPQTNGVSAASAKEIVHLFAKQVLREEVPGTHGRGGASQASDGLRAEAEAELSRRLRALLRQHPFQSIAGSWLATEMVVRSCPDDSRARFSAVDASWEDLVSKPLQFEALLESGVSVVVIDHCISPEGNDLCGLAELVRACHEHEVFLVAGAAPSLAGLDEEFLTDPTAMRHDVEAWQHDWSDEQREGWARLATLREQGAQFALALPRCLVRHPYGKQGEPLEKFEFEEFADCPDSVQFLWANGAYLVARALMEQWCGRDAQVDGSHEIRGLPVVTVPDVGGRRMQSPIELSLSRSAVEQLLDQGFSVIEARRDSDRARVHV